jgi:wobble nucleotide-excising tRNase
MGGFMFSQIDIESFGSFTDLTWKKSLKDAGNTVQSFKRLNILYGRNYSGKTTLSRIFRALETGRTPNNYVGSNFTVRGDQGDVTQTDLVGHGYDVRVYNRDFVSENLSFLVNQADGEIKTFAIVGEKNKELDKAIAAIQVMLGSVESKAGLRHELEALKKGRELTKINHKTAFDAHASLKTNADTSNTVFTEAEAAIFRQDAEVIRLQGQQKDERKGAERVNDLLNHFFGYDGIKLEAKDNIEKTSVKFEVTRDGKSAYNLSEGECSLIAFCYFIAKLEDPDSKGKDLIIYIDDPISSLDGNHIFYMFSLIESLIAKPIKNDDGSNSYRYKQLFISTHNLDFLKYLKKISLPNEKNHGGHQHFIVERNGGESQISLMPSYLRNYITEFNYLFHQIYKCRNQSRANEFHEPFYGFGNNLRKFLEAFLFFKFPYHDDENDAFERIKKFFGEADPTAIILVNRLNNEFSHLESNPDRGFKPVEIPEISKIANYVLDKIYAADPDQYNALLKSIGQLPRTQ